MEDLFYTLHALGLAVDFMEDAVICRKGALVTQAQGTGWTLLLEYPRLSFHAQDTDDLIRLLRRYTR